MVWVSSEEASGRRDKGESRFGEQSENEIVNAGHVVSRRVFFETGLVLMQRHIAGIMQAILNAPVGTQHL